MRIKVVMSAIYIAVLTTFLYMWVKGEPVPALAWSSVVVMTIGVVLLWIKNAWLLRVRLFRRADWWLWSKPWLVRLVEKGLGKEEMDKRHLELLEAGRKD